MVGKPEVNNPSQLVKNLHITQNGSMSEIAFHEKAGWSQVDSFFASWNIVFLPPSGHCRHASIRTLE